jgi:acetyl esterase/lipase
MAHVRRYVGEAGDLKHPLASPLYADMRGLPPLLILVGTNETLLDDSTRVADKARDAGVDVELEIWNDMIHIWPFFAAILPQGQQAIERMAGSLAPGWLSLNRRRGPPRSAEGDTS